MEIKRFWVVLVPTRSSAIDDVIFCATIADLPLYFAGGLTPPEIHSAYLHEITAREVAQKLLDERDIHAQKTEG